MGVYIPYTRLPSAYQEVEYIESTGTQYIDTGVNGSGLASFEIKFAPSTTSAQTRPQYFAGDLNGATKLYGYFGGKNLILQRSSSADDFQIDPLLTADDNPHILSCSSSGIYLDGEVKRATYTETAWGTLTYYVFNSHSETNLKSNMKLYYLKMSTDGTLVRNFVPCYRKSDNVIGLYDLVNNQFYTNSGTGTFSKGADVYMSELKNAYIGEYHKTFTISWEEKADMSSGWTYSDDAAGLIAGSTAFDDFFGYSGVRLSTAGVETAEEKQNAGVLDITKLGTLTSGDNVMIKFPVLGIKMSKSGSVVTLSITKELNKTGYQYYAHTKGSTVKNAFYIGAYEAYNDSNILKSWSGKTPTNYLSLNTARTYAGNNGTGYGEISFFQKMFISALYIMKYGNPNCQSTVGAGYTGGSSLQTTGLTDSQTSATYGTSSSTQPIKIFGLENRWGNLNERLDGTYTTNSKILVNVTNSNYSSTPTEGVDYVDSGVSFTNNAEGDIASVGGTNLGMFIPSSMSGTDYTKYYTDSSKTSTSSIPHISGFRSDGNNAGIFHLFYTWQGGASYVWGGARIMYL